MGKKQSSINRGKKWTTIRKTAEFQNRTKDVEWMDKQKSIVNDIKNYEDSLKPIEKEKPVEPIKSKEKK